VRYGIQRKNTSVFKGTVFLFLTVDLIVGSNILIKEARRSTIQKLESILDPLGSQLLVWNQY